MTISSTNCTPPFFLLLLLSLCFIRFAFFLTNQTPTHSIHLVFFSLFSYFSFFFKVQVA